MKKNTTFLIISLVLGVALVIWLFVDYNSKEESILDQSLAKETPTANYPYPFGVLFTNQKYTYFIEHVTDPGSTDAFMVAGYNDSSSIEILENGTALVTFTAHPKDWNGGGTLAQRPVQLDPYNVNYDLSNVQTISFEIRSADFDVNQISFGLQWEGPNYNINDPSNRKGGEKLLTLKQLGIEDISNWTKVSIDVSLGGDIPDKGTQRYEHEEIAFHADAGNTYVKVPLMMIWAGRSHVNGESLEIRSIAFQNSAGKHVEIASDILKKAEEYPDGYKPN